jgi:tetratricopeptide (TPR) repeat protein
MWSFDQLDGPARRLFCGLGVFSGGASLSQAEAVCRPDLAAEVLDALGTLVDHSLLRQGEACGEPRFWMLETIRELALVNLRESGELEAMEERHAAAYLALAEETAPRLTRAGRKLALDRLEVDVDNLRTALSLFIARAEAGPALRMAGALWRFWQARGQIREGRRRTAEVLALPGGAPRERMAALSAAGGMAYWQADMPAAGAAYGEALELARRLGEPRALAQALYDASFPVGMGGDVPAAMALLEEGLAIAQRLRDASLTGEILWGTGTVYWYNGGHAEAEPFYERALQVLEGTDAVFVLGWALRMRGAIRGARGDVERARGDLERALRMFAADDDRSAVVLLLQDFAGLALRAGERERAFRLAGAAAAAESVNETKMLEFTGNKIPDLAQAAERIGRERAEALLAEGRAMSMAQAVGYALEPRG